MNYNPYRSLKDKPKQTKIKLSDLVFEQKSKKEWRLIYKPTGKVAGWMGKSSTAFEYHVRVNNKSNIENIVSTRQDAKIWLAKNYFHEIEIEMK